MSDADAIFEAADRFFAERVEPSHFEQAGERWPAALWQETAELGFPLALASEEAGGAGLDAREAFAIVRAASRHAAPIPLAETMLANWLLSRAGSACRETPLTVAASFHGDGVIATRNGSTWHLRATLKRVAWARHAGAVLIPCETPDGAALAIIERSRLRITAGDNLAGEPRDDVEIDCVLDADSLHPISLDAREVCALGAALRVAGMAGAMERVLEITVAYAGERIQFGRPLAKFQAVQQSLAAAAEQAMLAAGAANLAAGAFGNADGVPAIAAAKAVADDAAGKVAAIAHQVHGAIGVSAEYPLHRLTRRLWAWREEFGSGGQWASHLATVLSTDTPARLWPAITAVEEAAS